jgi:hypothetical protein
MGMLAATQLRSFCLPVCYVKMSRLKYTKQFYFLLCMGMKPGLSREEHRLKVFHNRVLRKIFGSKWDELTRDLRKLHNEEISSLYSSPNIIKMIKSRRMRWAGHVARMGHVRNVCKILVGKPDGKRPLGRPRRRWEGNIQMDLSERGLEGVD